MLAVGRDRDRLARLETQSPPGVRGCLADTRTPTGAATVVAAATAARATAAVVYAAAAGAELVAGLTGAVERLVLVRTSEVADPRSSGTFWQWTPADLPADRPGVTTVVLGWAGAGGATRWHSPAEVSAAAQAALVDGVPRLLGRVRPWGERP